ncbi:MAG: T9SS type A sorting domain-containing protein [Paludibacteraceae bacterium]
MYVDYVRVYQKGVEGEEYDGPVPTLGSQKIKVSNLHKIYPNPTYSKLKIDGPATPAKVVVFTTNGNEVLTLRNKDEIKISSLPSGNYIIKISSANISETHSFTKK